MFTLFKKIITVAIITYLGVYACKYFFPSIEITSNTVQLALFVFLLSTISIIIKPILNIILKPFIFLTLGILSIIINMGIVFVANYYTGVIVIDSNFTLFKITFVLGTVAWLANLIVGFNSN